MAIGDRPPIYMSAQMDRWTCVRGLFFRNIVRGWSPGRCREVDYSQARGSRTGNRESRKTPAGIEDKDQNQENLGSKEELRENVEIVCMCECFVIGSVLECVFGCGRMHTNGPHVVII